MRVAFIVAFTSEKRWMTIEKSLFRNWPLIRWRGIFKGLSQDGGRANFLKNLCNTSFNKDLSNEPTFGLIHIAGQYL